MSKQTKDEKIQAELRYTQNELHNAKLVVADLAIDLHKAQESLRYARDKLALAEKAADDERGAHR